MQKARVKQKIIHLDDASNLPDGFSLIVANEFFDALPIRQFMRQENAWQERRVTLDPATGQFCFCLTPIAGGQETLLPAHAAQAIPGSIVEISHQAHQVTRDLATHIAAHGGTALIVDYGYHKTNWPADNRFAETLQAVRAHTPWPALSEPGTADLTAHVDFTALAKTAEAIGLRVAAVETQGIFLQKLGLAHRLGQLLVEATTTRQAHDIETAGIRLVDPQQMGTLFKVLGFCHPSQPPMPALEA